METVVAWGTLGEAKAVAAGTRDDARAALQALEEGTVQPQIMERLELRDVNRALDLLRAGAVLGRVVVVQ